MKKKISLLSLLIIIYITISPIENTLLLFPGITVSRILGLIIILFGSVNLLLFKKKEMSNPIIILPILLVYLLILASSLWNDYPYEINKNIFLYTNLFLFTTVILLFRYSKYELLLMKIGLAITGVFVSINIVLSTPLTKAYGDRITFSIAGGEIDLNNLAISLVIAVVIIFSLIEKKLLIIKILGISSIFVIIYAIFLTGSRGGLITLVPSILIFFYLKSRKSIFKILKSVLIVSGGVLFSVYLLQSYLPADLYTRFFSINNFQTGQLSRTGIWSAALESFSSYPLFDLIFGKGVGSFPFIVQNYYGSYIGAHNDYINFLIEFGIVGLMLLIFLLVKTLRRATKKRDNLLIALIGVIILGSLSVDIFQRKIYWIVIFLCSLESTHLSVKEEETK